MSDGINHLMGTLAQFNYQQRSVVPGLILAPGAHGGRERTVDFQAGIADLEASTPVPQMVSPDAPVMTLAAGGFFMLLPQLPGDEALGVVSDRAIGEWTNLRTPGLADQINGKRSKVLADILLTPFSITAPAGAPETWDHLVLGGPAGPAVDVQIDGSVSISNPLGPALEVAADGRITITKQGAPLATITMDAAGSVTIEVLAGQSVNLGGAAALALAKAKALTDAVDAMLTAMIAAALPIVPPAGDGGTAGFNAGQIAWNAAKSAIAALKAKGE